MRAPFSSKTTHYQSVPAIQLNRCQMKNRSQTKPLPNELLREITHCFPITSKLWQQRKIPKIFGHYLAEHYDILMRIQASKTAKVREHFKDKLNKWGIQIDTLIAFVLEHHNKRYVDLEPNELEVLNKMGPTVGPVQHQHFWESIVLHLGRVEQGDQQELFILMQASVDLVVPRTSSA